MVSWLLVFIQFFALGLIFVTGPPFPTNPIGFAVEIAGIGLGIWAVLAMGFGNFNIVPDPVRNARLVKSGPYSLIRHPMYFALLLLTLPLIIDYYTLARLVVWLALLVDLVVKLNYEEGLLVEKVPGYAEYRKETYRLVPFVY